MLPMRAALRFLVCLAISCSLALAAIPAQAAIPQKKASCCAKTKIDAPASDCSHQTPKSNDDKQCCSTCAFCMALLSATTTFIYPPTGEESFAALSMHERVRSHRPPVPPPRA
jgi:hypothetical protein